MVILFNFFFFLINLGKRYEQFYLILIWRKISAPALRIPLFISREKFPLQYFRCSSNSDIMVKLRPMQYQRSVHNNQALLSERRNYSNHWHVSQLYDPKMIMKADVMGLPHTSVLFCASPIPWINMFKKAYKLRISIKQRCSNKETIKNMH